jgi:hypothetical protein
VTVERSSFLTSDRGHLVFTAVKYLVYLLLSYNVFLFLDEELLALEHTFVDGFEPGELIQAFSATIDTAAWVVLLILFELETSLLDDRLIKGWVKWALHGVRDIVTSLLSMLSPAIVRSLSPSTRSARWMC